MFLRELRPKKDGKEHSYWSLVEAGCTPEGRRQRTLCYLGELNRSAQARRGACFTPVLPALAPVHFRGLNRWIAARIPAGYASEAALDFCARQLGFGCLSCEVVPTECELTRFTPLFFR